MNRRRVESAEKGPQAALHAANGISPPGRPVGALFGRLRGRDFDGTRLGPAASREPRPQYGSDTIPRSEKPYRFVTMPGTIAVLGRLRSGRAFTYLAAHFPAFLTFLLGFFAFTIRFRSHPPQWPAGLRFLLRLFVAGLHCRTMQIGISKPFGGAAKLREAGMCRMCAKAVFNF